MGPYGRSAIILGERIADEVARVEARLLERLRLKELYDEDGLLPAEAASAGVGGALRARPFVAGSAGLGTTAAGTVGTTAGGMTGAATTAGGATGASTLGGSTLAERIVVSRRTSETVTGWRSLRE